MPYFSVFKYKTGKTIVIFEISILGSLRLQFHAKQKNFEFVTKIALFWYFWAVIVVMAVMLKNYCGI